MRWPINGLKGRLDAGQGETVALLNKILPDQESTIDELDKLKVSIKWKIDMERLAAQIPAEDNNIAAPGGDNNRDIDGPAAMIPDEIGQPETYLEANQKAC